MTCRCAPAPNPDRMIYFVLCRFKDGLAWTERDVRHTDRDTTIEMIRNGSLYHVTSVLECNPVEGTCRDVTEDMLAAAQRRIEPDEVEDFRQQLVDWERDHRRDLIKHGLRGW